MFSKTETKCLTDCFDTKTKLDRSAALHRAQLGRLAVHVNNLNDRVVRNEDRLLVQRCDAHHVHRFSIGQNCCQSFIQTIEYNYK